MSKFKRLKASTLAKPPHVFADPYRIVLIEYVFDGKIDYGIGDEVMPFYEPPYICSMEWFTEIPMDIFEERMRVHQVGLNEMFVPDVEYSEWG